MVFNKVSLTAITFVSDFQWTLNGILGEFDREKCWIVLIIRRGVAVSRTPIGFHHLDWHRA